MHIFSIKYKIFSYLGPLFEHKTMNSHFITNSLLLLPEIKRKHEPVHHRCHLVKRAVKG